MTVLNSPSVWVILPTSWASGFSCIVAELGILVAFPDAISAVMKEPSTARESHFSNRQDSIGSVNFSVESGKQT
jgi:hypothetical protein